ncbi:serine hydrolase domain-containing protein [Sandaracinobacteroides saxicola]|uniref:Beta-lactamase family protein n=1 Tax=Sandaracinobacteroides saxicola TaxID=2759707 RepID=A0A7G5IGC7_9SPHN|nr:serine hydrolase domain-containing protein [Sandaracinobacteroides saxicola]QMW22419.1 beta-lactamase family protein [Sandaracinobacteroides saxicola]
MRTTIFLLALMLPAAAPATPLEQAVAEAMAATGAKGLAIAVIDRGRVTHVSAHGLRNAAGQPLTRDTVMYAASLTKTLFAATVLQLAAEGRLTLDAPIASLLPKPLPDYAGPEIERRYARWSDLAGDDRWRLLTPRILLTHASGFSNFGFLEPDGKLRFHFTPGSRYAYSGDGIILLQFVLEAGLGLDVGTEMQRRLFAPAGAGRTAMMWRADFADNLADGWKADGQPEPHDERSKVRAAGSLDSSIADLAAITARLVRRQGAALFEPQRPITSRSQFPSLQPEAPVGERWPGLAAGLGVVTFTGPQGRGFFKGGHNDSTGNMLVCLERRLRCVLILSNDVRAEPAFPRLTRAALGETGLRWAWEYGTMALLP